MIPVTTGDGDDPAPPASARPLPDIDPVTAREVLGPDPDLHDLAILRFDVLAAVVALEREIQAGAVEPRLRLVRGRPLADWLSLEKVAYILRRTR